MWRIIKAELNYNRLPLCLAYLVTVGIWLLYLIDPAGLYTIFGVPFIACFIALFGRDAREKRTRQHICLPVSAKTLSISKMLLFVVLLQIIMISAWSTQAFVERSQLANEFIPFSGLMTFSSLTLIFGFGYVIMQDVSFFTVQKNRIVIYVSYWFSLVLFILILFFSLKSTSRDSLAQKIFVDSFAGAIFLTFIWISLILLRMRSFQRRCSYLE